MSAWRLVGSLQKLREQIDDAWPARDRASDGTIGDSAHQSRNSDHNPWFYSPHHTPYWTVTALDITHDPRNGPDCHDLAKAVTGDPRIKYIIFNGGIMSGTGQDRPEWLWRDYSGVNQHTRHMHVSVKGNSGSENTNPWNIGETHMPLNADDKRWLTEMIDRRTVERLIHRTTEGDGDPVYLWWLLVQSQRDTAALRKDVAALKAKFLP
jgi:hypothetical protein